MRVGNARENLLAVAEEVNQSEDEVVRSFVVKCRASNLKDVARTSSVGIVESSGDKVEISGNKVEKKYSWRKVRFKRSVKELALLLLKQPGLLKVIMDFFSEELFLIYFKVHMLYVVDDTFDSFYAFIIVKSVTQVGVLRSIILTLCCCCSSQNFTRQNFNCCAFFDLVICQVNAGT